jgi:hypothetical protein
MGLGLSGAIARLKAILIAHMVCRAAGYVGPMPLGRPRCLLPVYGHEEQGHERQQRKHPQSPNRPLSPAVRPCDARDV